MEAKISQLTLLLEENREDYGQNIKHTNTFNILRDGLDRAQKDAAEMREKFQACSVILTLPGLTLDYKKLELQMKNQKEIDEEKILAMQYLQGQGVNDRTDEAKFLLNLVKQISYVQYKNELNKVECTQSEGNELLKSDAKLMPAQKIKYSQKMLTPQQKGRAVT